MKCLSYEDRELIRRARRDGREARRNEERDKKKCAIGETECNENLKSLSRQRIDQKRKKGWGRGRSERIEKGSRERIEIERKETKGNELRISRETSTLASACCSASSRH